jgi:hypothetical protein
MNDQLIATQDPGDATPFAVPEPITALRLATIDADGSTTLVSVAHRFVLADAQKLSVPSDTPHLDMAADLERQITEAIGARYDGSWPGWDAVFTYIDSHPDVLSPGE